MKKIFSFLIITSLFFPIYVLAGPPCPAPHTLYDPAHVALTGGTIDDVTITSKYKLDHNVELLNADRTILITDKPIQWYDCNGSSRNVTLPAEASSTDLVFTIVNTSGTASETIVLKDDTPTTLATVPIGQGIRASCDGTSWKVHAKVESATATAEGISERSTDAEAITGTDTSRHTTPANLVAREAGTDIDRGGYYALQLQNIPDLVAKGAGYWFDGTDDVITVADDADIDFGTADDFYIEMEVMPLDVTRTTDYLVNKEAGGIGYGLYINQDDLYIRLDDNTHDVSAIIGTAVFSNYVRVHVLVSFDRSGDATAYINGKSVGTVDISSVTSTISSAGNLHIGQDSAGGNEFNGEICKGRIGNLTKTATEVKALSSGAPVPYKYLGASPAELIDDSDNTDFADGTINEWVVIGASEGDGTCIYDAGPGGVKTAKVTVGATPGTATAGRLIQTNYNGGADMLAGKTYQIEADIYIPSGGTNHFSRIGVMFENYSATAISNTDATLATEDSWQHVSATWLMGSSDLVGNAIVRGYSTTTGDIFYFDNISITQIGCVLQLEQDGIGHNQWQDNSGNELHGTVSGALPINLPVNHQEKYVDLTVTGNGSFTLPMGHKIKSIIVKETAGNALTGGLDVGLSANGVEVVSGMAVAGSATVLCTLVEAGTIGATFTTADDTIYFSDGDDDGNWTSAELELRVQMERLTLN